MNDRGSIAGTANDLFLLHNVQTGWGSPSVLFNGYGGGAVSTGIKRQRREADQSGPSTTEIKNIGAIPPLRHMSSWHSAQLRN
jgi:hypothetical protein